MSEELMRFDFNEWAAKNNVVGSADGLLLRIWRAAWDAAWNRRAAAPIGQASDDDVRAAFEAWHAEHEDSNKCCHDSFKSGFRAALASTRTASDTRTAAGEVECDAALGRAAPASQHGADAG